MYYGDSFKKFLLDKNVPCKVRIVESDNFIFLDLITVGELIKSSHAIEVPNGGLIIGNFHNQGGVHILRPFENEFCYLGEMEGYEYLINPTSTKIFGKQITELNYTTQRDKASEPKPFNVPVHIKKIDLSKLNFHIIVIPDGDHFIVNRAATEKYLERLDNMNDLRIMKKVLRFFKL
jgi:hypothetical protein